jgi:hypothetical protein
MHAVGDAGRPQDHPKPDEAAKMTNGREFDKPAIYQIELSGHLEQCWSDWFSGLTIVPQAGNKTLLVGTVTDQGALHGMLAKIRDLGLPLLSIQRLATAPTSTAAEGSPGAA